MFRTRGWRFAVLALTLALGSSVPVMADGGAPAAGGARTGVNEQTGGQSEFGSETRDPQYYEVLEQWKKEGAVADHNATVTVPGSKFVAFSPNADVSIGSYKGKDGVLVWEANGDEWVEFEVNVAQGGLYAIEMSYHPFVDSKNRKPIALNLTVDGATPFLESKSLELYRHWRDKLPAQKDANGDEIRPVAEDISGWMQWELRDLSGAYEDPLLWRLTPGKHIIRLAGSDPMALESITFKPAAKTETYETARQSWPQSGPVEADPIVIEAEKVQWKNDSAIALAFDNDIANSPFVRGHITYNTLDGDRWATNNQQISWSFEVPESGYYQIAFRQQQAFVSNRSSFRSILINGKIPFSELKAYRFKYASGWKGAPIADERGAPYEFYLPKGTNTISMRVTQAPLRPIISDMDRAIGVLTKLTAELRTLTGGVDDKNRTWELKKDLPGFVETFSELNDSLIATRERLIQINGSPDAVSQALVTIEKDMESMLRYPDEIPYDPNRLNKLQGKLSEQIQLMSRQPLQLDRIYVVPAGKPLPKMEATTMEKIEGFVFNFFNSFKSASGPGEDDGQVLNVWMNRNRDYVNMLQGMADESFTPKTGIKVKVNLLKDERLLLLMNAAGMAPDVAIGLPQETPFNYALRGGMYDLKQFPDFEEVFRQFSPGSWIPYYYDGGYYAVPETQTFSMLFYRKDILERLGLAVPDTWDDVYRILPILQQNNMNFTPTEQGMFLQMHGAQYYKQDGSGSGLGTEAGIQAFKAWTDLQNKFGIDQRSESFYQHFRDGSYPIGIADLNAYIQLLVSAPELNGLWGVAPIPGVKQADGTVARWTEGNGGDQLATAIFKQTKKPQESWEFLKWWMSADVQVQYATDLETLYGVTFRWYTANIDAFVQLPWKEDDLQAILEQWRWFREVAKVPGSYYTERELKNAWTRTVINGENYRTSLETAVKEIDREVRRKMQEFRFIDGQGNIVRPLQLISVPEPWEGVDKYVKK
ncbi:extracellular solute-binding protein [Paenibacillus chartarius]|uniref:Extracellular solute-binding protein n=1 Tax=Paenibacillus chartarius TaxID=747481 RepID=A0ABV6DDX6_9BACL